MLLDGKLQITPNDWLMPIKENAKRFRNEINRVRKMPEQLRNDILETLRLRWYARRDSNPRPLVPETNALSS